MSWLTSSFFGASIAPGGYTALTIVLSLLFAALGYRSSTRFRSLNGVTPWHVPSLIWAVICLILTPIGFIIELLAQFTTRPNHSGAQIVPSRGMAPVVPRNIASSASARSPASMSAQVIEEERPIFAPPNTGPNDKKALFGWYPDVTGRHELRYWDGRGWTQMVNDGGVKGNDPLTAPTS